MIGKRAMITHTTTRETCPVPNQNEISGTMARIGIACSVTRYGNMARSANFAWLMMTARVIPEHHGDGEPDRCDLHARPQGTEHLGKVAVLGAETLGDDLVRRPEEEATILAQQAIGDEVPEAEDRHAEQQRGADLACQLDHPILGRSWGAARRRERPAPNRACREPPCRPHRRRRRRWTQSHCWQGRCSQGLCWLDLRQRSSYVGSPQRGVDLAAQLCELRLESKLGFSWIVEGHIEGCDEPTGRDDITSTRVLMNTASLIEWVMNSPAKPSSWKSCWVSSLRCSRVISSTAPNGSSNRKPVASA